MKAQNYGAYGELLAVKFLKKNGYQILEQNFSAKTGEVDIIALETKKARKRTEEYKLMPKADKEAKVVVFVEVKSRTNLSYGAPAEFVDKKKINNYGKVIPIYLSAIGAPDARYRCDIIEVVDDKVVSHIKNAF